MSALTSSKPKSGSRKKPAEVSATANKISVEPQVLKLPSFESPPTPAEFVAGFPERKLVHSYTETGLQNLGNLLTESRERLSVSHRTSNTVRPVSIRTMAEAITRATGYVMSKDTLGNLEAGNSQNPTIQPLMAIALTGYVLCSRDGRPYTFQELLDIATETRNPYTGEAQKRYTMQDLLVQVKKKEMSDIFNSRGMRTLGKLISNSRQKLRIDLGSSVRPPTVEEFSELVNAATLIAIPAPVLVALENGTAFERMQQNQLITAGELASYLMGLAGSDLITKPDGTAFETSELIQVGCGKLDEEGKILNNDHSTKAE